MLMIMPIFKTKGEKFPLLVCIVFFCEHYATLDYHFLYQQPGTSHRHNWHTICQPDSDFSKLKHSASTWGSIISKNWFYAHKRALLSISELRLVNIQNPEVCCTLYHDATKLLMTQALSKLVYLRNWAGITI